MPVEGDEGGGRQRPCSGRCVLAVRRPKAPPAASAFRRRRSGTAGRRTPAEGRATAGSQLMCARRKRLAAAAGHHARAEMRRLRQISSKRDGIEVSS